MDKNNQPFKKRIELVFTDTDKDIWDWLEKQSERKATFIKKVLRNMMNDNLLEKDDIQKMIQDEVQKALSKVNMTPVETDIQEVYDEIDEVEESDDKPTFSLFKAREF